MAKFLVKFVSNVGITSSIAPDHKTLLLFLALPETTPRGPGFWKFNNTLLDDENYTAQIRDLVLQIREKYSFMQDKQLFWELMKMEIREKSILFAKQKSRALYQREKEISKRLDYLDTIICNSNNLLNISDTLNEYEALKTELHSIYDRKGKAAMFRSKCEGLPGGSLFPFSLPKLPYVPMFPHVLLICSLFSHICLPPTPALNSLPEKTKTKTKQKKTQRTKKKNKKQHSLVNYYM